MNNVSVKDRHKTALNYAASQILKWEYANKIKAIYLFGSYARGEQSYDSDVDIYIICSPSVPKNALRKLKIMVLSEEENMPEVDVKFGFNDLNAENDLFHDNIKKEGILLWQKTD